MLAGVATRRHVDVAEPLGAEIEAKAKATGRSSVSRRFKRATEAALAALMARELSGLDVAVIMIDGLEIAGQCCVVALVFCADGTKVPVGLWLGHTENKTVVTGLLADLAARGLSVEGGLLAVLDGAKALAAGVKKVFGEKAQIQRCTLHKRRNVKGYLPKELGSKIDWRLARAFADTDPARVLDAAWRIAGELKADHPDAAGSLLEGLEEMFTVRRLGVNGRLAATLTNTNCIESTISVAGTTIGNVKNWKDGSMKKRWVRPGCSKPNGASAASVAAKRCPPWSPLFAGPSLARLSHPPTTIRLLLDQRSVHRRTSTEGGTSSFGVPWPG